MESAEVLYLVKKIEERYADAYTKDGTYIEGDWHRLEWFLADFTIAWPMLRDFIKEAIGDGRER